MFAHDKNEYLLKLLQNLLSAAQSDLHTTLNSICGSMMDSIPNIIFASLLTYNKFEEEITYSVIKVKPDYNEKMITDLIKDYIILKEDSSTSGRLINSDDPFLIIDNVLLDPDYKSIRLAEFLGLKKGIFLKLRELKTKDIYGVLILYPSIDSPINQFEEDDFKMVIYTIENILSNSKRMKEDKILREILEAAKKVKKDLGSFAQKCAEIISKEISAKGCSIFIIDPLDDLIKLKGTLGVCPGPALIDPPTEFTKKDVYYKMGEGVTGSVAKDNEPMMFSQSDVIHSKWRETNMSSTFLVLPIPKLDENKAIGVIRCATKPNKLLDSTIEAFNHDDIDLLNYIAKIISVFIELSFYQENQKQLIAKVPHEIRASITNIGNICEYIELKVRKEKYSSAPLICRKINDVEEECYLSLMTVNSLHIFDDSIAEYEFSHLNIFTDIIAKTRKMLNPIAHATRNLTIHYDNASLFPKMYLDKYRLQIVFHNLLLNAIKYSTKKATHDKERNIQISSAVSDDGNYFTIGISNYGIGVPKNKEYDIFINGFRTFEAIKVDPSGRGFGLALVKNILGLHQIEIKVTHNFDPTTFTLYFPKYLQYQPPMIKDKEASK